MKAFLLKLAAIIVQHKLVAGIVAAAVVAGGVTTGVVVHNNNVNNNDVVVAENETKETKEKETTKKTISLESLKVALKDEATVFYTDSAITNDLFTVIGVYTDKSEKELTEFTITPVELVVGENIINFVVKDNGKDVSVDFTINVVDKPTEVQSNEEYNNVDNTDYNNNQENNSQEENNKNNNFGTPYLYLSKGYLGSSSYAPNIYTQHNINGYGEEGEDMFETCLFFYYDSNLNSRGYLDPSIVIEIGQNLGYSYLGEYDWRADHLYLFEKNGIQYYGQGVNLTNPEKTKDSYYNVTYQTNINYAPFI